MKRFDYKGWAERTLKEIDNLVACYTTTINCCGFPLRRKNNEGFLYQAFVEGYVWYTILSLLITVKTRNQEIFSDSS